MRANTNPSIDSLKVRIPINEVEIVNPILLDHQSIVNVPYNRDTSEFFMDEAKFNGGCYEHYDRGIKTKYIIQTQQRGSIKGGAYLVFLITSKQIATKEGYFEGITQKTIEPLYHNLMGQGVAKFSLDTLLNAHCTDIDIKKDFDSTELEFGELTKRLKAKTHQSTELGRGQKREFNLEKGKNGIWWATRQTKTPRTNPYIKLYSKHLDLSNQTKDRADFVKHILGGYEGEGIFRVETTIKNKDHLSSFGLTDTSLKGLLSLPKDTLDNILSTNLKKHLEPRQLNIESRQIADISPKDRETINFINICLKLGQHYQSIRRLAMIEIKGANLSKRGNHLDHLYHTHIEGSNDDKSTKEMEAYFDLIGY